MHVFMSVSICGFMRVCILFCMNMYECTILLQCEYECRSASYYHIRAESLISFTSQYCHIRQVGITSFPTSVLDYMPLSSNYMQAYTYSKSAQAINVFRNRFGDITAALSAFEVKIPRERSTGMY